MDLLRILCFSIVASTVCVNAIPDLVVKNYNGKEFLDPKKSFSLEWTVDWEHRTLHFNITVETKGWVGLGFSEDGLMKDADLMIAGVGVGGKPYISDYHTDCHRNLLLDAKQDWQLLGASENNGGKTTLHVSRLIDSCDGEDYPITDDLVNIIWAYGSSDTVEYHNNHRGNFKVYLLDPVMHSSPLAKNSPRWAPNQHITLPTKVTTYWCSIHKKPDSVTHKNHFIEIKAVLENSVAVNHTHHFLFWRCMAPEGVDPRAIYEPLVPYQGEECYFNNNHRIPINLCRQLVFAWAIGGNPLILPDHVGIPFGSSRDEYYMLEIHYNNPEKINGISFEAGVETIYTDKLRQKDGSLLIIGHDLFGFFMVPPGTPNFETFGHCNSNCTQTMFPSSGIDVFAIGHHTHVSGRQVKLQHFRNGNELSWILKDDNYDFTFQQPRPLHRDIKLLPGDHLTEKCVYDNSWTNVTSVAGFSTKDEMCLAILYYTAPIPYYSCTSQILQEQLLKLVGVQNVTWDFIPQERLVTKPDSLKGQRLAHVMDDLTDWTKNLRAQTAAITSTTPQIITCPSFTPPEGDPDEVMRMAHGYGDQTLFGHTPLPHKTPGPYTIAGRPFLQTVYGRGRQCIANKG